MDVKPNVEKLYVVPGWLEAPYAGLDELFYVALPLGHNVGERGENFGAYAPGCGYIEDAKQLRDKVIQLRLPLFGIVRVSCDGAKVVWRNDDPITGEAPGMGNPGYGTW